MTEEHYKNRELDARFIAHEDLDKQRLGEIKDILAEGFKDISEKIVWLTEQVKTSNGRTRKLEIKWAWATGAGGVFVAATLGAGGWMFNAILVETPSFVSEQVSAEVKQEMRGYKLVSDPPVRQSPIINTINIRNATTSDDILPISTTTP